MIDVNVDIKNRVKDVASILAWMSEADGKQMWRNRWTKTGQRQMDKDRQSRAGAR